MPLFNDLLGTTLGKYDGKKFIDNQRTSFGSGSTDGFFTGKPHVEGLGYAFLFRNYRAELGKWQTQDPLGYPDGFNNFAYCNNKIISIVDPLGLAGTLTIVGEGGSSGGMFDLAAATDQSANGGTVVNVSTGQELVDAINNYVAENGTIDNLNIYCHSSATGLYVNQGEDAQSLYVNGVTGDPGYANVSDISATAFSSGASITLWGCNTNNSSGGGTTIAQAIANQTGASVTGCTGPTAFSGTPGGSPGEGLPDPVPANYTGPVYMVPQYPNQGYTIVTPQSE